MGREGDRRDVRKTETAKFKRARLAGGKNFEHNLAIGAVTNTRFLTEMKELIQDNIRIIRNRAIKEILNWTFDYHDQYGRAPHLNIKDIFEAKREALSPADEDIIGDFLAKLSRKYEEIDSYNAEFEIAEVTAGLQQAKMTEVLKEAGKLVQEQKCEEACELVIQEGYLDSSQNLGGMVLSLTELITTKIKQPKMLIRPWLTANSVSMIYGERGVGKSWLTHILAISLTREEGGIKVGEWLTRLDSSVMLVDGELPKAELQYRLKNLVEMYGMSEGKSLYLLAEKLNLTKERERNAIVEIVKQRKVDVLFLDNISCLFPGLDENSKKDWDLPNQWLLSLKATGLAVVLIHHAGKQGKQRGTSGREDALDTVIRMTRPRDYDPSEGARFWVSFDKARKVRPGASVKSFQFSVRDLLNEGGG